MDDFTRFCEMELQQNFDLANENLIRVFSKYTKPIQMDKCTCSACIKDHSPKQFDLRDYLPKAITTWGTKQDFKHYLPQILSLIFIENEEDIVSNHLWW